VCLITYSFKDKHKVATKKIDNFSNNPTWANLEITAKCNAHCEWCYLGEDIKNKTMSFSQAKNVVDILYNSDIKQITISGGEPTLIGYLPLLVDYIVNKGIVANLNTNGYLLDDKLIDKLNRAGLNQIQTNIESINSDIHDEIRKLEGSHKNAIKAIKKIKNTNIKVTSQIVVTKDNESNINDILKYSFELGVDRCRIWDSTGYKELAPSSYKNVVDKANEMMVDLGATHVQSYEPLPNINFPDKLRKTIMSCPALSGMLVFVDVEGNVFPCSAGDRDSILYNIFDYKNINEVHHKKVKGIINLSKKCEVCKYVKSCKGGCLGRRYNGKDWYCQEGE